MDRYLLDAQRACDARTDCVRRTDVYCHADPDEDVNGAGTRYGRINADSGSRYLRQLGLWIRNALT